MDVPSFIYPDVDRETTEREISFLLWELYQYLFSFLGRFCNTMGMERDYPSPLRSWQLEAL